MGRRKEVPAELVTVAEAARATGFSRSTLYRWMDEGAVQCVRVGGSRYIVRASLAAWLARPGGQS